MDDSNEGGTRGWVVCLVGDQKIDVKPICYPVATSMNMSFCWVVSGCYELAVSVQIFWGLQTINGLYLAILRLGCGLWGW